ncbi:unnamed protein product [Psylliodes chrysocephalus]|uniref:Protein grindelwald n=1 Tax=Psylliodes chrysocephalus TaxID=3402493 RepID=A0A9P0D4K2_9CUCU|nr:unnamed protein product [Psylliodes chrysocephala]
MLWIYLVFIFLGSTLVRSDGLIVGSVVKCGVKNCSADQYCSEYGLICESCAPICDPNGHNFDKVRCEKSCQVYLHDLRYVNKNGGGSGSEDLKSQVDKLSRLVTVSLTLTILMLLVLVLFLCFQFYRWKEKKNITIASLRQKFFGKRTEDNSRTNADSDTTVRKGELKLDMPSNMSHSEHSPVTVTTSISRRPAEDSTLDYAYDNPALSPSR